MRRGPWGGDQGTLGATHNIKQDQGFQENMANTQVVAPSLRDLSQLPTNTDGRQAAHFLMPRGRTSDLPWPQLWE